MNLDRIGHRYPPYRYEISAEKLREYVIATSFGDSDSVWPLAVEPPDVAPPGFAACFTISRGLAIVLADGQLGAHTSLVHASQSYQVHRPMRVGDVLECALSIVDIVARSGMELLTVQIDCADPSSGAPVVTSRGTLILFDRAGGDA